MVGNTRTDRLRQRVEHMREILDELGALAWRASSHISHKLIPGEFRSPFRFPSGFERDVPRVFTVDDDPRHIYTKHIPPSLVVHSMPEAVFRGDIRLVQSVFHGESLFLTLIDLSRSVLSGCFIGTAVTDPHDPMFSKLEALYTATTTYLQLAEASGFVLRAGFLWDGEINEERPASLRSFAQQISLDVSDRLMYVFESAEMYPASQEQFTLRVGLEYAASIRNRSVIVVISDFLDPFEEYSESLARLLSQHKVVLVDISADEDWNFPIPTWRDLEASRTPTRDGSRHLEMGTVEKVLDRRTIQRWNSRRQADRRCLLDLSDMFNVQFQRCYARSFEKCYVDALEIFNVAI